MTRNLVALKRSKNEDLEEYASRLRFEVGRRCTQLLCRINPWHQDQYRIQRLAGPMGIWPHLEQYQLNALVSLGLKPHHSLLDIGCGPITVGLTLVSYLERGNYFGVDLRLEPLVESYRRIAKHSLADRNPRLISSATFGRDEIEPRQFDYIWVSQLSYHLDDGQMLRLFEQARSRMNGNSVFLIDILDPDMAVDPNDTWNGFSYHVRPYAFYEALASRLSLSVRRRGSILEHGYPKHINLSANRLLEFHRRASPPTDEA